MVIESLNGDGYLSVFGSLLILGFIALHNSFRSFGYLLVAESLVIFGFLRFFSHFDPLVFYSRMIRFLSMVFIELYNSFLSYVYIMYIDSLYGLVIFGLMIASLEWLSIS